MATNTVLFCGGALTYTAFGRDVRRVASDPAASPPRLPTRRDRSRQARVRRWERTYRVLFLVTALIVLADLIAGGLRLPFVP
jgi:hypothetical protein